MLLPPLLVLSRVGGARSPSVSSALWLPVGSSTRPVEAWPRPSLISMVNVVFILPPGSAVLTATGNGAPGSSERATGPPAPFSRGLGAKPRPLGPSSWEQLRSWARGWATPCCSLLNREEVSLRPREEEPLEEEAGVVLVREGPTSLAGVRGLRAARGVPSWSLAAIRESDVNLWTRSRTEPARWNEEGLLARGVDSRFWAGWWGLSTDRERWQGRGPATSALLVSEGPLVGLWAAGVSLGPDRSLLTTWPSVLVSVGDS